MTFQHLWRVMLQYSWLVMAVASHGTAQPLMPTAPHETSHRPHQDTHTSRHRTKAATSNVAKKNPKGHAGKVWSLVLLAGGVMALFVYSSLQDPSTRIPDSQVPSLGQGGGQHALHKPVQQLSDTNVLHTIGPKGLSNTSTDSQVPSSGQVGSQHVIHKPVQQSISSNPFDALVFGAQEKAWHASLGPLPDNVKIEDYELNPAFLAADILPNIAPTMLKAYPWQFHALQKQLTDLFARACFKDDERFSSPYDEDAVCNTQTVVKAFKNISETMNHKNMALHTRKTFNYVIDKMHALDIGKAGQADDKLTPKQFKNRDNVRMLLRKIPIVYRECFAVTEAFNAEAVTVIGLKSVVPLYFPAKMYVYLKRTLRGYLDMAGSAFLIKERVKNKRLKKKDYTEKEAQDSLYNLAYQHIMNALEGACKNHIQLPKQVLVQDDFDEVSNFMRSKESQKTIIQSFLAFFRTNYAKLISEELRQVVLNAYYGDVPLNSYLQFAKEKGLGRDALFVDDMHQALAPDPFLRILVNIKLLTPKSSQA